MPQNRRPAPPMYHQFDVSQDIPAGQDGDSGAEQTHLLREILAAQDRQNELLEELVGQLGSAHRQRQAELGQWKESNPKLAHSCRMAAEALSKVQTEFLVALTEEIAENHEVFMDGEFMLNEFVDRFGPRMAHLNGILQVLSQLSATPSTTSTHNSP